MRNLFGAIILFCCYQINFAQTATETVFTIEEPERFGRGTRYELGTEFQVSSDGHITKTRLYSHISESGDHSVRLWRYTGSSYTLTAGPYTWNFSSGIQGWREYTFPSSIEVQANTRYIISITTGTDANRYYAQDTEFTSVTQHEYLTYIRGLYTTSLGSVPSSVYRTSCYFRDIVFSTSDLNSDLTPGSIGMSQTICSNTSPSGLTELTAPTGGTGEYTYQWQSSPDNSTWINIVDATFSGYSPPVLSASTYYRRIVTSGSYPPVYTNSVLITVSPAVTLAQLHDDITIENNTSAHFTIVISGGVSPFTINYTRNGEAQPTITSYSSGTNVSTGVLTTGVYTYTLTSVTDARGCAAQSLGSEIIITVTDEPPVTPVYETLFSSEVPESYGYGTRYELGTEFQVSSDGHITKTRLYSHISESGDHSVRLWRYTGSSYTLLAIPYTWNFSSGIQGWREYTFPSPIEVQANTRYIISITTGTDANRYYARDVTFTSATPNDYLTYIRGLYTTNLGSFPSSVYRTSCYFRDIVFSTSDLNSDLTSGSIGPSQTICSNTSPSGLTELTAPTGGTGEYTYQWQSSSDNSTWTNIVGATFSGYSPPVLSASTYYRRIVTSGSYPPVYSNSVLITVSPAVTLAQLHDDITIENNTSTHFNIVISGGVSPFTINYTRNGEAQPTIASYSSGTNVSTGLLTTGVYTYTLTSVTDARGCAAQSLGSEIIITVTDEPPVNPVYETLFSSEVPESYGYGTRYELGTEFQVLSDGHITRARLYSHVSESGDHSVRLWRYTGSSYTLLAGPYTWNFSSGIQGWREFTFPSPIEVQANTRYIISITTGTDPNRYYVRDVTFTSATPNDYLTYIRGLYTTNLGSVPSSVYRTSCYFRDIVFSTTSVNPPIQGNTNKALVIVNSSSQYFSDYTDYINPYLDNFGIPYDICNISSTSLPELDNFAIVIFGHKNVYLTGYPVALLETAVQNGVGLYSFDPHLFDFSSGFNTLISQITINTDRINIPNTAHFITQYHIPDVYSPDNNLINLLDTWSLAQKSNLINGISLATMSSGGQTISLLQVANYGNGKIVKWCGYDWMFESILGPVYGMDDLIWRSIVWAARKPFVMQGLPPMITMRVDDVDGTGGELTNNFEWIDICNEFGIIPWCGTFNNVIPSGYISTLRTLLNNNLATASPHAFSNHDFIYFNHENLSSFDAAANTINAKNFYLQNRLKMSRYILPHYYEISSAALPEVHAMGGEFIGTHMLPDNHFYGSAWINNGPYRINRYGSASSERPVYYADYNVFNGISFFNCLSEIRDDGGYEWYPDNNVTSTSARGIRHLRRSLNSMILPSLFTHEQLYIDNISISNWRQILQNITSSISSYNPEYTSMDYAIQYIRAKHDIRITNVVDSSTDIKIYYSGNNDLQTKCYLFTGQDNQITHQFVNLPQINGSRYVSVLK